MSEQDEDDGQFRDPAGVIARLVDAERGSRDEYRGMSDREREHNRLVFGQTYRERYGRDHKKCIILCRDPGQREPTRCPCCYRKAGFLPLSELPEIEPLPTKGERFAAWLGAVIQAFLDGFLYPIRRGREHQIALVRDVIQDAMAAGLTAEVVQKCPECERAPSTEVAIQ